MGERATAHRACRSPYRGKGLNGEDDLLRENQALRERLSRLSAASLQISESLVLDEVLQEVIDNVRHLTSARYGAVSPRWMMPALPAAVDSASLHIIDDNCPRRAENFTASLYSAGKIHAVRPSESASDRICHVGVSAGFVLNGLTPLLGGEAASAFPPVAEYSWCMEPGRTPQTRRRIRLDLSGGQG